jgi:signal transduction histidine kinase
MFRVNESEEIHRPTLAERVVQVALLVALLANFASAYQIYQEQRRFSEWSGSPDAARDLRVQFAASLGTSAILVFCLAALWWLRRRYLSSQQYFRQVKMLAHNILASMDRGVVTTNREGIITSINSAAIGLLKVDFECVGRPLTSISSGDAPLMGVYQEVVGNQAAVRDRDFNVDRAGRFLRLRVDGHALTDTEGTAMGCVIHLLDVTERSLLEERMRRMERFLGLAALASGLHHEIKNPLTALSIHIQLLEESLENGNADADMNEIVHVLGTEVRRLNGVLESFRTFANLQHLTIQPTDAVEVVENAIRLIRPQAAAQQVQITLLHPEKELPPVALDAEKFEQAVLNLIINALEAMPTGGNLTVSATVAVGEFQMSVKDSGPGIPAEVQRNLFQPYFSTKDKGSGLGLALTEKLISQHGGRIDYRTGPDGTSFEITIPLEQREGTA